jgi:Ca2+-transporting ATPase
VYAVLGQEISDAVTIFVVILLLVLAEVWNEFRAKKAINRLKKSFFIKQVPYRFF